MRLDLLLVRLRFSRSRAIAQRSIGEGHIRCNGERVQKANRDIAIGDVLTLMRRGEVVVARIEQLPDRRLSAAAAMEAWTSLR